VSLGLWVWAENLSLGLGYGLNGCRGFEGGYRFVIANVWLWLWLWLSTWGLWLWVWVVSMKCGELLLADESTGDGRV
jgi:hypothetical protein